MAFGSHQHELTRAVVMQVSRAVQLMPPLVRRRPVHWCCAWLSSACRQQQQQQHVAVEHCDSTQGASSWPCPPTAGPAGSAATAEGASGSQPPISGPTVDLDEPGRPRDNSESDTAETLRSQTVAKWRTDPLQSRASSGAKNCCLFCPCVCPEPVLANHRSTYAYACSKAAVIFRENKLIALEGSTLLGTAWTVDHASGLDRPISYVVSNDSGRTFSAPRSTGLIGQTATPCHLGGGRVLCVYRRKVSRSSS